MQNPFANHNTTPEIQLKTQRQTMDIDSLDYSRDNDWLSEKFNNPSFLLYKFWLALNSLGALFVEYLLITKLLDVFQVQSSNSSLILLMSSIMSITLILYGYVEMLFAIHQRESRIAQRSFLKFQYYFIGLLICYTVEIKGLLSSSLAEKSMYIYAALNPILNLIGGSAVLKAFRENHPLQKQAKGSEALSSLGEDFFKQNRALASEISKYDLQLNSWPYIVYNWWLKLAVVFEISFIFNSILSMIVQSLPYHESSSTDFLLIGGLILPLFTAYSRFEMEVAMRTRDFIRVKRAVLLLKITIISSILSYLLVAMEIYAPAFEEFEIFIPSEKSFAIFIAIPVICLAGALKVQKLIEQRERFARVSSYNAGSYLL